jgi:microcystin-dependent protein
MDAMSSPYVGEIRMFGGNFAPLGWMLCQGQELPISEFDVLFNLIGTTYGGDGQQTFALPNLSSRFPVHQGSGYVMGQAAGVEQVTLTVSQMPVHSHGQLAAAADATTPSPANAVPAAWADGQFASTGPDSTLAPNALGLSGGSQPHDNMPPYLCINFIISLYGIFP